MSSQPVRNPGDVVRPWWLLPPGRLNPLWWIAFSIGLLWLDISIGPERFPVMYLIPVILAAWYSGRWPALTLAIAMPVIHAVLLVWWWQPNNLGELLGTTAFRGVVIMVLALWFERLSAHEQAVRRHVETLEGLLSICAFCKRIKNKDGEWEGLEKFISSRSEAQFSHAFCPACQKKHYPDFADP